MDLSLNGDQCGDDGDSKSSHSPDGDYTISIPPTLAAKVTIWEKWLFAVKHPRESIPKTPRSRHTMYKNKLYVGKTLPGAIRRLNENARGIAKSVGESIDPQKISTLNVYIEHIKYCAYMTGTNANTFATRQHIYMCATLLEV